ncbi:MAG: NADH:flavin oxidoreductase, partial [Alphaproteobacteria bacterium]|nr:NADH:flavin oxidoreductase [Alphaproteobacteria bacterium]
RTAGLEVTLVTPHDRVSRWAMNTGEGWRVPAHLMKLGIRLTTAHGLSWFDGNVATITCEHSRQELALPAKALVVVGEREPIDDIYSTLRYALDGTHASLPFTLTRIGDCEAPAIIAAATYSGHRYAQDLDREVDIDQPMRHDKIDLGLIPPPI